MQEKGVLADRQQFDSRLHQGRLGWRRAGRVHPQWSSSVCADQAMTSQEDVCVCVCAAAVCDISVCAVWETMCVY